MDSIEDNKENRNNNQLPPTLLNETIDSNTTNATTSQSNLSINIHLPIADRAESKLSLIASSREISKSLQQENNTNKKQQTHHAIVKSSTKIEFPLIRTAPKMMPVIKENMSSTDMNSQSNDLKANKKQRQTAPPLLNKEMKSAPSYFSGQPISNGFLAMKVNPTIINDFAYLNRNKLVNRRLAIRKQMNSSALKAISILPDEFERTKSFGEFALGNPHGLNNSDDQDLTFFISDQQDNADPVIITPDSLRLLDGMINVDSEMNIQGAANSFENINTAVNEEIQKQPRLMKSSSIVILEKNSARNQQTEEISPVSYHIPRRPPNQKNSPMYTIGKRCFNEKNGGGRTSWEKEWFNSTNPFTIKSDFKRDQQWPTPVNYNLKSTIGADSSSSLYYQYPSVKIHNNTPLSGRVSHNNNNNNINNNNYNNNNGEGNCSCHMILSREDLIEMELRKSNTLITTSNTDLNAKKNYLGLNVEHSVNFISSRAPKIQFQFRNNGTQLWPKVEKTPGPGAYDHNKFKSVSRNRPKFSLSHARYNLNSNYKVGPFAAL